MNTQRNDVNAYLFVHTYLINHINSIISYLVAVQSGMVSALPRHKDGIGLDILDSESNYKRLITELLRLEVQKNPSPELGGALAPQFAGVPPLDELLVVLQPFPQLLRVATARQWVLCANKLAVSVLECPFSAVRLGCVSIDESSWAFVLFVTWSEAFL